jgi:hypothetical protein
LLTKFHQRTTQKICQQPPKGKMNKKKLSPYFAIFIFK